MKNNQKAIKRAQKAMNAKKAKRANKKSNNNVNVNNDFIFGSKADVLSKAKIPAYMVSKKTSPKELIEAYRTRKDFVFFGGGIDFNFTWNSAVSDVTTMLTRSIFLDEIENDKILGEDIKKYAIAKKKITVADGGITCHLGYSPAKVEEIRKFITENAKDWPSQIRKTKMRNLAIFITSVIACKAGEELLMTYAHDNTKGAFDALLALESLVQVLAEMVKGEDYRRDLRRIIMSTRAVYNTDYEKRGQVLWALFGEINKSFKDYDRPSKRLFYCKEYDAFSYGEAKKLTKAEFERCKIKATNDPKIDKINSKILNAWLADEYFKVI